MNRQTLKRIILGIGITSAVLCILIILFMEKSPFQNFMVSITRLTGMVCLFVSLVWLNRK